MGDRVLDDLLCFDLYSISRTITGLYRPVLEPAGLTYPQFLVLVTLTRVGPSPIGEIGRATRLDHGTLTPLLRRLAERGLLSLDRSPTDARSAADDTVTVRPVKPAVSLDDFAKLDLRVCEIVKCQEIRKSHNCYKLTLNDGLAERVIVSSIKRDYTPEQLNGKKIIVLVNLAPARITGVTSEGMLLATASDGGRCTVVFADERVPNGSSLH